MRVPTLFLALMAGWTVSCAESRALPKQAASNPDQARGEPVVLPEEMVPNLSHLCAPCNHDDECVEPGAACLSYGAAGSFCGQLCQLEEGCPTGYACQGGQCRHLAGECPCSDAAITAGVKTSCRPNGDPACTAQRWCTDEGLTACDGDITCAYQLSGTSFADSGLPVSANTQFATTAQLIGAPRFTGIATNTSFIATHTVSGGSPK